MVRYSMSFSFLRTEAFYLAALVLAGAMLVFLPGLSEPSMLFWDENYHLTSAHKYLAGVMSMEAHPPLGKLLIALSEWFFGTNLALNSDGFLSVDHIGMVPEGYDFFPARFPSALMMTLSIPLFYWLLCSITQRPRLSLVFTLLPLLDTAIILHTRAAHLDGIQIFFVMLTLCQFAHGLRHPQLLTPGRYALLAFTASLAIATKINGCVLLLCPIFWWGVQHWQSLRKFNITPLLLPTLRDGLITAGIVAAIWCTVFYIHCGIGEKTPANRIYSASEQYQAILAEGSTWNLSNLPVMLRDNMRHMAITNGGVPPLRPYENFENGSHPLLWPLGVKSINYRWDKLGDTTRYLQLTANPIGWGLGLLGILTTFSLMLAWAISPPGQRPSFPSLKLSAFFALWLCYMIAALTPDRVFYLYHYFLPLIFSWVMIAAVTARVFDTVITKSRAQFDLLAIVLIAQSLMFWYMSPLAYHLPLTPEEFEARSMSILWGMKAIR
jgi:dolichyl-phosphate-mannose-protein mannosyltransferase